MGRPESSTRGLGSRALIVDNIRAHGPISRVELAALTGLTQASVSGIVKRLIYEGYVAETGDYVPTGGKPRASVQLNPAARVGIGMNISRDSITFLAVDFTGSMIGRERIAGAGEDPPAVVLARVAERYQRFVDSLTLMGEAHSVLTLALPGPLDTARGHVLAPPTLPHWQDFPIADHLESLIGQAVVIENDASAAAYGEYWSGRTPNTATFAAIYCGSGIGAGYMLDGVMFRGSSANTGELGHTVISLGDSRPCECGGSGCLEQYVGAGAVIAEAISRGIGLPEGDDETCYDALALQAVTDHETAREVFNEMADRVAHAVLNLTNLLDLDVIVVTGPGADVPGAILVERVRSIVAAYAFSRQRHAVDVQLSPNPRDSAALGAATLGLGRALEVSSF